MKIDTNKLDYKVKNFKAFLKANWSDLVEHAEGLTGEKYDGQQWLHKVHSPLERIPVFLRKGSEIPIYPDSVNCVDQMDFSKIITVNANDTYKGFENYV